MNRQQADRALLATLCTGEEVHRRGRSIVIPFTGQRRVLSTAPLCGGYREDLTAAINHDCTGGAVLQAHTLPAHMAQVARQLGEDPQRTAALVTAAQMENAAIVAQAHRGVSVTAIVTGGAEVNGGRVGDPAVWDELDDAPLTAHGTINILLHIGVDVPPETLVRALVTCTEAKTAALQELVAPSKSSSGLATGTGTDGAILIANRDSPIQLTNAGKHSKLGELIGGTVKAAVKQALYRQTGLSPGAQHHAIKRLERFEITEDALWALDRGEKNRAARKRFAIRCRQRLGEGLVVANASLVAHLMDQVSWGLLAPREAYEAAAPLLEQMGMPAPSPAPASPAECVAKLTDLLARCLVQLLDDRQSTRQNRADHH